MHIPKKMFMKKKIAAFLAASTICAVFTGCNTEQRRAPAVIEVSSSFVQSTESSAPQSSISQGSAAQSSISQSSVLHSSVTQSTAAQSSVIQSTVSQSSAVVQSTSIVSTAIESAPLPTLNAEYDEAFFNDALFIGDSIFTGVYLYGYLARENVAAAIGYTAYGAQVNPFDESYYSGNAVDYAKFRQPKKIIIMLGTNSLHANVDLDDFENGYRGLINSLKEVCPESKICAVSVPPITADSSQASYSGVTNAVIDSANERIKSLCVELGTLYYDLNSVLKDGNGYFRYDYAEADGMHFKGVTYPVLLSGVQKILE